MITKNKSLIALFLTFGAFMPCSLFGYFINISVLGNRETGDIVVLVGDLHGVLASFEEDLQQIEVIVRGVKKGECVGRETDLYVESMNLHGQALTRNFFEVEKLLRFRTIENQYRDFLERMNNGVTGTDSILPYLLNIELPRQLTLALKDCSQNQVKAVDPRQEAEAILNVLEKSLSSSLVVDLDYLKGLCFKSRMQIYDILEKLDKCLLLKSKISTVMRCCKKAIDICVGIESAIEKNPAETYMWAVQYAKLFFMYSPLELYLYYELCVSQRPAHFFFYGILHIADMKKVLIESDGYEELMFYGMRCDDLHDLVRILQNKDSRDPEFHSSMLLHLEEVMGLTHEELWALELEPKPHRVVKSKL